MEEMMQIIHKKVSEHLKHHDPPVRNIGTSLVNQFNPRFVHLHHQYDMFNVASGASQGNTGRW
jgi:hypothetical protein